MKSKITVIFSILVVAFFINCSKSENDSPTTLEGEYEGVFTVKYGNDETLSNPVQVSLINGQFSSSTGANRLPAGGNGKYKVQNTTIEFNDENVWTADFDWNLILNGEYNYSLTENKLIISAHKNDVGFYKYELKKK
ncbi:hypothetical protein [Flagellimonas pacifica]|uniref:Lipocalin-like domain-containing protein n=1 Tax=Flagellimonas pacifica TaxID=1247520 RepID=A0A285MUH4_9FLAO|nr:hypothetical protein [Allomuricauda parva]SNZ00850.1 hypothetical protein SAMN06265377_2677 [Allomuricauda parva]